MSNQAPDFTDVTEAPGVRISPEALDMLATRYQLAVAEGKGRDVLEVGCGPGLGLGWIAENARRAVGGDVTETLLRQARSRSGKSDEFVCLAAEALPFASGSFDVIVLYEAVYYLKSFAAFLDESSRVLRSPGTILICSANREWKDFNVSPLSSRYPSAAELDDALRHAGYRVELFGGFPESPTLRSRVVSCVKRRAAQWGLIPKTMKGKEWLKMIAFGGLVEVPERLSPGTGNAQPLMPLVPPAQPADFRVLFAVARRRDQRRNRHACEPDA